MPGISQYMASAVLLLCHGMPEPLLDVNMARVLERVFGERKLADIRYDSFLQELARSAVAGDDPVPVNWAILDLAATICLQAVPHCYECPLAEMCRFNERLQGAGQVDRNTTGRETQKQGIQEIGAEAEICRIASRPIERDRLEVVEKRGQETFQ